MAATSAEPSDANSPTHFCVRCQFATGWTGQFQCCRVSVRHRVGNGHVRLQSCRRRGDKEEEEEE